MFEGECFDYFVLGVPLGLNVCCGVFVELVFVFFLFVGVLC